LAALAAVFCLAAAADPADRLADPGQEARARALFEQIRCVVCQNESIDDSEADLARDMRQIVRGQVAAGRSDAEIRGFLVRRYGEFVLLRPRFSPANAMAWLAPFAIVLAGGGVLLLRLRRPPPPAGETLTPEEEARLAQLRDS
jgi:cytochrome c-type biogenesis protein CcmH